MAKADLSLRLPDPATFGPDYDAQILGARRGKAKGQRDFLGARLGRGASFINALQRRDAEIRKDIYGLRAHSRHLDNNNPWMRNYLRMMVADIIGPKGFTLQVRMQKPGQKPGEEVLWEEANDIAEAAFRDWSQQGVCTVDGRHSFLSLQHLTGRTLPLDGEGFIREVFGFKNGYGYALQFLDADLLDINLNQEPGNGRPPIVMGVELDSWGRPAAYWFRASNIAYSYSYPYGGRQFRVPAEEIIHIMDPERVNQTRGVPFAAPVMYLLSMLGTYLENELAASRFETERFMALENDGSGDPAAAANAAAQIMSSGLHAEVLPPGFKAVTPELRHPNSALPPYVQTMLHGLAAGLGVSYHGLTRDPSQANYTSTRADDMVDRPQKMRLQTLIEKVALNRIYANFIDMAYLSGKLKLPTGATLDMAKNHRWIPRGWVQLDPLKDRQGDILGLNNALETRTKICGEDGEDFEDVVRTLAYEQRLLKKYGVTLTPTTVITTPAEAENQSSKKGEADAASA